MGNWCGGRRQGHDKYEANEHIPTKENIAPPPSKNVDLTTRPEAKSKDRTRKMSLAVVPGKDGKVGGGDDPPAMPGVDGAKSPPDKAGGKSPSKPDREDEGRISCVQWMSSKRTAKKLKKDKDKAAGGHGGEAENLAPEQEKVEPKADIKAESLDNVGEKPPPSMASAEKTQNVVQDVQDVGAEPAPSVAAGGKAKDFNQVQQDGAEPTSVDPRENADRIRDVDATPPANATPEGHAKDANQVPDDGDKQPPSVPPQEKVKDVNRIHDVPAERGRSSIREEYLSKVPVNKVSSANKDSKPVMGGSRGSGKLVDHIVQVRRGGQGFDPGVKDSQGTMHQRSSNREVGKVVPLGEESQKRQPRHAVADGEIRRLAEIFEAHSSRAREGNAASRREDISKSGIGRSYSAKASQDPEARKQLVDTELSKARSKEKRDVGKIETGVGSAVVEPPLPEIDKSNTKRVKSEIDDKRNNGDGGGGGGTGFLGIPFFPNDSPEKVESKKGLDRANEPSEKRNLEEPHEAIGQGKAPDTAGITGRRKSDLSMPKQPGPTHVASCDGVAVRGFGSPVSKGEGFLPPKSGMVQQVDTKPKTSFLPPDSVSNHACTEQGANKQQNDLSFGKEPIAAGYSRKPKRNPIPNVPAAEGSFVVEKTCTEPAGAQSSPATGKELMFQYERPKNPKVENSSHGHARKFFTATETTVRPRRSAKSMVVLAYKKRLNESIKRSSPVKMYIPESPYYV